MADFHNRLAPQAKIPAMSSSSSRPPAGPAAAPVSQPRPCRSCVAARPVLRLPPWRPRPAGSRPARAGLTARPARGLRPNHRTASGGFVAPVRQARARPQRAGCNRHGHIALEQAHGRALQPAARGRRLIARAGSRSMERWRKWACRCCPPTASWTRCAGFSGPACHLCTAHGL